MEETKFNPTRDFASNISQKESEDVYNSFYKDLRCKIFPLGHLKEYKYTVIFTSYQGKWIFSRHRTRNTWETQGGHIETNETPLECAKRELFEESGITDADIYPVCDYLGFTPQTCSTGIVFLAVTHSLGTLPESEIAETKIFDVLPAELTYPLTLPSLYAEAEKFLKDIIVYVESQSAV